MARKYSMGYFADGNGAMEGVEYSADLAEIQKVLNNQNDSMLDWMDAMDERLAPRVEAALRGLPYRLPALEEALRAAFPASVAGDLLSLLRKGF